MVRGSNFAITRNVADLDFHEIAAAQLAIDGEIEKSPIPNTSMLIKESLPRLASIRFALIAVLLAPGPQIAPQLRRHDQSGKELWPRSI